jgi:Rad3-related DNA helicase
MHYTETFPNRNLLINDESQDLEKCLLGFVEINFSSYYLSKLGITSKIPIYDSVEKYIGWLEVMHEKAASIAAKYSAQLEHIEPSIYNQDRILKLKQEMDALHDLSVKIEKLFNSYKSVEWIFDIVESKELKRQSISFKPLTVAFFANDLVFKYAAKKILMSATILDKDNFCKTLGIPSEKSTFIRLPSTFDKKIRPIILTNTGDMGKEDIDSTLPKIVKDVEKMLDYHDTDRGLIHCHTFKIADYIMNNIDIKYKKRLLSHTSEDRESKFDAFLKASGPTVFLTPSMTEGIDLKDDLARFVAIVKIPYLFLGDKQIKKRAQTDGSWYRWRAALTIVQAAGRGVRHKDDYCTIYIMDSGFKNFLRRNREFFPDYFVDAIKNL